MKRYILTHGFTFGLALGLALSVALMTAHPASSEERDVHESLKNMFRAAVADLSDFDPGLCGESGTFELRSTDGVWSCESPSTITDPVFTGQALGPDGTAAAPTYSFTNEPDIGMMRIGNGRFGWTDGGSVIGEFWGGDLVLYQKLWAYHDLDVTGDANFDKGADVGGNFSVSGAMAFLGTDDLPDSGTPNLTGGGTIWKAPYAREMSDFQGRRNGDVFSIISEVDGVAYECNGTEFHCGPGDTITTVADDVLTWLSLGGDYYLISHFSSGAVFAPSGTVGTPGFAFADDPDTGFYLFAENTIGLVTAGVHRASFNSLGNFGLTGKFYGGAGYNGAATYSWSGDAHTGMYQYASDVVGITAGGTAIAQFSATGLTLAGTIIASDGTEGAPSYAFATSPDTGMYLLSSGVIRFSANGGGKLEINGSSVRSFFPVTFIAGTAASPALRFQSDLTTGIYQATGGDGDIDFTSATVHAATLNAAGLTVVGQIGAGSGDEEAPGFYFTGAAAGTGFHYNGTYVAFAHSGDNMVLFGYNFTQVSNDFRINVGAVDDPALGFVGDLTTGLYNDVDGDISFTSNGVHSARLNAAGLTLAGGLVATNLGITVPSTSDATITYSTANDAAGDATAFGLTINATKVGTGATTFAALKIIATNNGSGGTADAMFIDMTNGSGSWSSGLRFKYSETANTLASGIQVYSSGGAITAAFLASDAEIVHAIDIGANSIKTAATTIASTELDILDGGIRLNEIGDPTADHTVTFSGDTDLTWAYTNTELDTVSPFELNLTQSGTGTKTTGFYVQVRNENASGDMTGFSIRTQGSDNDAHYNAGLAIEHAEATGALYYGVRVTGVGPILYGIDVSDSDIDVGVWLGANSIETETLEIAGADFDAVFGGVASNADAHHTHADLHSH